MKSKPGDKQRLAHILDAIREIESYTAGIDLTVFLSNSMMRFASIKQIEIIGEAAAYISEQTKQRFTEIQWKQIIGMRHVLVHEYFGIDSQLVWQVIIGDLPELKKVIQQIYSSI
jgi:uncharacterized protein with HEPN domain